ncbi:MAG: DUF192 domain-containing protein [Dehalococcoidia bacterium]
MVFVRAFFVFIAMVAFSVCGEDRPPTQLPTREITVEGNGRVERLTVELATTSAQQQQGLMFRQAMPEDAGMLFLFANDSRGGFWMRNTYLPLSIAYLDASGVVLEIRDGKPLDDTVLTPGQSYRNVLEVNQGWFDRHGLGVGSVVRIPPDVGAR